MIINNKTYEEGGKSEEEMKKKIEGRKRNKSTKTKQVWWKLYNNGNPFLLPLPKKKYPQEKGF